MSFIDFLLKYYLWIIAVLVILIITIIGFLADKRQKIKTNKKEKAGQNNTATVENVTEPMSLQPENINIEKEKINMNNNLENKENSLGFVPLSEQKPNIKPSGVDISAYSNLSNNNVQASVGGTQSPQMNPGVVQAPEMVNSNPVNMPSYPNVGVNAQPQMNPGVAQAPEMVNNNPVNMPSYSNVEVNAQPQMNPGVAQTPEMVNSNPVNMPNYSNAGVTPQPQMNPGVVQAPEMVNNNPVNMPNYSNIGVNSEPQMNPGVAQTPEMVNSNPVNMPSYPNVGVNSEPQMNPGVVPEVAMNDPVNMWEVHETQTNQNLGMNNEQLNNYMPQQNSFNNSVNVMPEVAGGQVSANQQPSSAFFNTEKEPVVPIPVEPININQTQSFGQNQSGVVNNQMSSSSTNQIPNNDIANMFVTGNNQN